MNWIRRRTVTRICSVVSAMCIAGCAAGPVGVASTGAGVGASSVFGPAAIIGSVLLLGGWLAPKSDAETFPGGYLPTLAVVRANKPVEHGYAAYAYVVLPKIQERIPSSRYVAFCRSMFSYFIRDESMAGQDPVDANTVRTVTIWPVNEPGSLDASDCREIVIKYDNVLAHRILRILPRPAGDGPILVAMPHAFSLEKKPEEHEGIYWDLSTFQVNDFDRVAQIWHDVMRRSEQDRFALLMHESKFEEVRNLIRQYGSTFERWTGSKAPVAGRDERE